MPITGYQEKTTTESVVVIPSSAQTYRKYFFPCVYAKSLGGDFFRSMSRSYQSFHARQVLTPKKVVRHKTKSSVVEMSCVGCSSNTKATNSAQYTPPSGLRDKNQGFNFLKNMCQSSFFSIILTRRPSLLNQAKYS